MHIIRVVTDFLQCFSASRIYAKPTAEPQAFRGNKTASLVVLIISVWGEQRYIIESRTIKFKTFSI